MPRRRGRTASNARISPVIDAAPYSNESLTGSSGAVDEKSAAVNDTVNGTARAGEKGRFHDCVSQTFFADRSYWKVSSREQPVASIPTTNLSGSSTKRPRLRTMLSMAETRLRLHGTIAARTAINWTHSSQIRWICRRIATKRLVSQER